jgi:hypothetical protein
MGQPILQVSAISCNASAQAERDPHQGGSPKITTPEQATLKAREQFDGLLEFVRQAAQDEQRIDTVERGLMRQLLALGHALLSGFIAHQGDGDMGPETQTAAGQAARRLPQRHHRRYVSIFGELTIARVAYGTREGQKIERVPLDERLGLPEGEFSYVLEDWSQRLCLKESFAEAGQSLEMLLGLRLRSRTLEHMSRHVAAYAPAFEDALPVLPPPRRGRSWSPPPMARACRCGGHRWTAPSPTIAGPRRRRRIRSRWPASGRPTRSSRS